MKLDVEQAVAADPNRPVLFVWASDGDFETFEALASDGASVATIRRIEDADERRLYRVQVADTDERRLYRVQVADTDDPVLYPLD